MMTSENLSSSIQNEEIQTNISNRRSALSAMWMKTLMRRDVIVAFVAFLAYFSVTILPLILNFSSFGSVSPYYTELIRSGVSPVSFITVVYAISLSVMLFDYLHSNASSAALHSFPVTRGKLFRTTVVTGTLLLLIPILLTAVLMCVTGAFMPAVIQTTESAKIIVPRDVLSFVNCGKWFIDTAVGALFVFAIANLAGIVAGKNIIHALLAYLLNGIVGVVLILVDGYAASFILGATETQLTDLAQYTNPFLWYMAKRGSMLGVSDIPMMLAFVAIALIITILTGLLYKSIKLEREQDATVFPVVSDLLVIFLSFCGLSIFGMIIGELMSNGATTLPLKPFLLGSAIGGVIYFIVFRMIADSSVRIFNTRSLISFIVLCAVTAVVFAFTCFDITGQTERVPDASSVTSAEIQTVVPFDTKITLNDRESVEDVISLHKVILKHRDKVETTDGDVQELSFTVKYNLKNNTTLTRSYSIDARKLKDVREAAAKLSSGDEYLTKVKTLLVKTALHNNHDSSVDTSKASVALNRDDLNQILLAYYDDYELNGFNYYYDLMISDLMSDTTVSFKDKKAGTITSTVATYEEENITDIEHFSLYFGEKDENLHKALKELGYTRKILKQEKEFKEYN